jgi:IMP dehydrogenase/GMP reductase
MRVVFKNMKRARERERERERERKGEQYKVTRQSTGVARKRFERRRRRRRRRVAGRWSGHQRSSIANMQAQFAVVVVCVLMTKE